MEAQLPTESCSACCPAAYIGYVMLSTWAPGAPAWATTPEQLQSLLHESFNFFYVNVGLSQLGLNPVPSIAEHPVSSHLQLACHLPDLASASSCAKTASP